MGRRALAPCGVLLLGWSLFWWPVISGGSQLFVRDLGFFAIPAKQYLAARLGAGEFPLWTSFVSAGMPFFADISNQVLYPLNLVLWVTPTVYHGLSWFVILHSLLGLWAFYALARAIGLSRFIGVWASLVYGLSGYTIAISDNINYLPAIVWVPLGLAGTIMGLRTGSHRQTGLGALCFAFLVLAGDTLNAAVMVAMMALISLFAAGNVAERTRERGRARRLYPLAHLAGVVLVGSMLVSVQVFPTAELLAQSIRKEGLAYAMVSTWSFPPARLLEFVQPYLFGSNYPAFEFAGRRLYGAQREAWANTVYIGLIPLLFAAIAVIRRPRVAAPWLLMTSVALLFSFGGHLPFFQRVTEVIPLIATQRYPEKLIFWVTLGVALLAGLGADMAMDRIRHWRLRPSRLRFLPRAAISLGVLLAAFYLLLDLPARALVPEIAGQPTYFWAARGFPEASHYQVLLLHLLLLAIPVVGMLWLRPRWRGPGLGFLLALAVADLVWVHYDFNLKAPTALVVTGAVPEALDRIRAAGGGDSVRVFFDERAPGYRVYTYANAVTPEILAYFPDEDDAFRRGYRHLFLFRNLRERLAPNSGIRYGVSYLNGTVSPLQPMAHRRHFTTGITSDPWRLMATSSVDYVITSITPRNRAWSLPGFREVVADPGRNLRIMAVENVLPARLLVPASRLRAITNGEAPPGAPPGPGSRRLAWDGLPEADAAGRGASSAPRDPRVVERRPRPEHRVIEVDSPYDRGYLVLTESWFPGWRATLDGVAVPLRTVEDRFMAIAVPPGRHTVVLRYHSTYLSLGLWVSLAGLIALVWLLWPRAGRR